LTTDQKGSLAEAKITCAALALGLDFAGGKNNQRSGINWASDFDFAATLARLGAVAQLGERLAGSQ
jgi:hypothetical protein